MGDGAALSVEEILDELLDGATAGNGNSAVALNGAAAIYHDVSVRDDLNEEAHAVEVSAAGG